MSDVANLDDAELPEGEEGAEGGKPKKKRLIMMIAGGLVLLAGIGGGAMYFMGGVSPGVDSDTRPVVESYFFDLPDMVINLNALDERTQYLKLSATLEMHDKGTLKALEPQLPKVLDSFQVYLRELRVTDIEGSGGLYRLKEELVRRINMAIYPHEISGVLFREIIVQ